MARPLRFSGEIAFVKLTKGYEAVIDASDANLVEGWSWQASVEPSGMVYAIRSAKIDGRKVTVRMHRILMSADADEEIDHHDVNGLNNRRGNLRRASRSQNRANTPISCRNTSGIKGVRSSGNRWVAEIRKNGRSLKLGRFATAELAQSAYVEAAQTLFGEFARSS